MEQRQHTAVQSWQSRGVRGHKGVRIGGGGGAGKIVTEVGSMRRPRGTDRERRSDHVTRS